jgi:signal transduction histidine kinase
MTLQELVNLIVIPLSLLIASLWLTRLFVKRDQRQDEKDKQIKELLMQKDVAQEKATDEWRAGITDTLCKVKNKVELISGNLHDKVDYSHCNDRMDVLDERIRGIGR